MLEPAHDVFETGAKTYSCSNCGRFELDLQGQSLVSRISSNNPEQLPLLSYAIRRMNHGTDFPSVSAELIEEILSNSHLPSPAEQVENLLLWLGENLRFFGEWIRIIPQMHTAVIGAASRENFSIVVQELIERALFKGSAASGPSFSGTLTLEGWQTYEELKRGRSASRKGFMAMSYRNEDLDTVFRDCFKPAVAAAGFDLRRLDEAPSAGLIDNRLRVEIRTSRFLVADLTGDNLGAYWEAGYAEGLGKPVIYTCEKSYFNEHKTHFDTNHHHTVVWDPDKLDDAAAALTVTIRATLPSEAIMENFEDNGGK
jgi:hypothetical protein